MYIQRSASFRKDQMTHSVFMIACITLFVYIQYPYNHGLDDSREPNPLVIVAVYILRLQQVFFLLPVAITAALGLSMFDAFPGDVQLKDSSQYAPFICFRTITRGDYPELVRESVRRNLETCRKVGLVHLIMEVVTDKAVNVPKNNLIREVVVPPLYQTKNGSQFKARGLQYCLEDEINQLSDSDWIVHLDEESLLTENSVKGIVNFVLDGRHQFGQGLITYANEKIVNWLTTCADCIRVANDMALMRPLFKVFHRPVMGAWKGSYMVCLVGAERKVSFDHGLEGSILEDVFFCLKAFSQGYSFDFIEGEMWEKSPFTLIDFIRQRKRWIVGGIHVLKSSAIPLRCKFIFCFHIGILFMCPLFLLDVLLEVMFRPTIVPWLMFFLALARGCFVYFYVYGGLKSFSLQRLGVVKYVIYMATVCCFNSFFVALETVGGVWAIFDQKLDFYIVDKIIA